MNMSNTMGSRGYLERQQADAKTIKLEKELEELKKREVILSKSIEENKKAQNNINLIINVFIILFVGVIIILLCDYLVELSIQIGMKKTTYILEPYINNKINGMNIPQYSYQPSHQSQNIMPYNYNQIQPMQNLQPVQGGLSQQNV